MRPIKLTISAFGPYANKEVIDFEELKGRNIFVISGKTGAGKTTIFDAISYALYGDASGESREVDSLRSDFADDDTETFVELEFELMGERYVVNRYPKQKKKKVKGEGYTEKNADATLTLPNDKVITKVGNVNDKITELLGIDKNQFKQIVMLAQGEFKKLLLAKSDEREKIFRKIFNTYDFEKIQLELREKASILSKNRSKSKDKIQTNIENIKGEHDIVVSEFIDFVSVIEKLENLIQRDSETYINIDKEYKEVDKRLQDMHSQHIKIENDNKLLKEKEALRENINSLISKEVEYKQKEEIIKNAINAKEIKYIEDKKIDDENKLHKRRNDLNISKDALEKLEKDIVLSKENLKIEEDKEGYREKLKSEIDKLISLEPKVLELDNLKKYILNINEESKKIILDIDKNKLLSDRLKSEKIAKENEQKEISILETKKVELENENSNKKRVYKETRDLYELIRDYQKGLIKHHELYKKYIEFEVIYNKSKNEYELKDDLYRKEQAGVLAKELKENLPCPVCGSTNHPSPAKIKDGIEVPTKEQLQLLKDNFNVLKEEKDKREKELTEINHHNNTLIKQVDKKLLDMSMVIDVESKYSNNTLESIAKVGKILAIDKNKIQEELKKVDEKILTKELITKQINDIENKLLDNEKELNNLYEKEKYYINEFAKVNTQLESHKNEIPNDINSVDTLKNIVNNKTKELEVSRQRFRNLKELDGKLSKQYEGEVSKSIEINKSIEELDIEIKNTTEKLNDEINKKGFESYQSYEEAKLQISNIDYLKKQVDEYKSNLQITKAKLDDINQKTKDKVFVDKNELEKEIQNIASIKKEKENEKLNLNTILESNKSTLENIKNLNNEFRELEDEYRVVGELSELANGRKSPYISFERYILASYFEDIIEAANLRLEKMTGDRFSLIRKTSKSKGQGQKGLELEIYDNYTDTKRDVSSLSGGESFKASLSLALGLSDVVGSNAGGVNLDTMFVDEGFGTLDPQSLDSAIDSLLELQRGGRLVGIISHVEELKERIEAKLEVISTSKGSRAKFNIL